MATKLNSSTNNSTGRLSLPTPKAHGQTLLWPTSKQIRSDLCSNRRHLVNTDVKILAGPLSQERSRGRSEIVNLAQHYRRKLNLPAVLSPNNLSETALVVTGHQCGFFHCGILAKYILANHLAQDNDGLSLDIIVDTDLPKNIGLKVPVHSKQGLTVKQLFLCRGDPHLPMEYQPLPSRSDIRQFTTDLRQLSVCGVPADNLQRIEQALTEAYDVCENPADLLTLLNHRFAQPLKLNHLSLPVSVMAESKVFTKFVVDFLFQSPRVRNCYNQSLAHFRRCYNIHSSSRPMPNLVGSDRDGGTHEMPFWVFRAGRPRQPLFVRRRANELILNNGSEDIGGIAVDGPDNTISIIQTLKRQQMYLRPRALAMTIFARLFFADYFVHGIGGAGYDQVADEFIRQFYHIEPPAYACASATMYLPLGNLPGIVWVEEQLRCIRHIQRDLRFNPQRYLNADTAARISESAENTAQNDLLNQRLNAIEESELLRQANADTQMRRLAFEKIHQLNEKIAASADCAARELAHRKETAQKQLNETKIAYDREYFFGLFPQEELKNLLDAFR